MAAKKPPKPAPPAQIHQTSMRATPLLAAVALLAVAILGWWWFRAAGPTIAATADRNVLLVTIDTLRADALGSYGGRATTPNLDRLAAGGARFGFAHAHAVVTLASHTSILSGRYPYEHGVRDNTGYRVPASLPTAATHLKAQGFATGAFVGGFPLDHRFGLNAGFDVYDDRLAPAAGDNDTGERERRADAVVASALDWIGKQPGKWFAWVHVYDPHVVYDPPQEWKARFPADPYLGEVSWTDAALAPLFDRLASQSRATLVVVTADHGESLGEHGEATHSVFAYEPVLKVPLIVTDVPGRGAGAAASGGRAIDAPVRHVDLLPTILDVTASPADPALPGASLRPLIASGRRPDLPSYFEAMTSNVTRGWAPLRGVLVGREKYIALPIAELYDLGSDPKEARNLAAASRPRAEVLFNTLKNFSVAPPGKPREESSETIDRLRSLGYIGGSVATTRDAYTEEDDPKRLIELEQALTRGAEAFAAGRIDEAVGLYEGVIFKRPDMEDAYRKLALVYWRTGRPRLAIATLELALKNGVTQREVRIKLGQYLAESGQPGRAIELLETFAGDDPDGLIALGNAYMVARRPRDALRTFEQLAKIDPGSALAQQNIGGARLELRDFGGAEAALRRAIAIDPNLAGAHTTLGVVLAGTGRRADAIDEWTRAVSLDPGDLNALYNLAVQLHAAGRLDDARRYGARFIAQAPPALQNDAEMLKKLLR